MAPQSATAPIDLQQAVVHSCGLEHQNRAWQQLQASLSPEQLEAFALAFRNGPPAGSNAATGPAGAPATERPILLPVPYLCQNDSATAQGPRMCFSARCQLRRRVA
ncbi:MAG: hypothetical protein ACK5FE_16200 [Cyanobacteriota bacterium]